MTDADDPSPPETEPPETEPPETEPSHPDGGEDPVSVNRAKWEEYANIHRNTDFYDVPGFLADDARSTLRTPRRELLGDPDGQSLVHLQCHVGLDTLSWAREGASVVGVDFAETADRGGPRDSRRRGPHRARRVRLL